MTLALRRRRTAVRRVVPTGPTSTPGLCPGLGRSCPRWNREGRPRRLLAVIGVDGLPASQHAFLWAAAEAGRRGAALDVVHAHDAAFHQPPDYC